MVNEDGRKIALIAATSEVEGDANANRIEECVNAMAGIGNPDALMVGVNELADELRAFRGAINGELRGFLGRFLTLMNELVK